MYNLVVPTFVFYFSQFFFSIKPGEVVKNTDIKRLFSCTYVSTACQWISHIVDIVYEKTNMTAVDVFQCYQNLQVLAEVICELV